MKIAVIAFITAVILFSGCLDKTEVANFEECVAAGNLVMESYPRQCMHNGQTFVEEIEEPILGASCGTVTPGYNDECCERQNEGAITPACVGRWRYNFETESCEYLCDIGCMPEDEANCDRSCEVDLDCKMTNCAYDFCINKDEFMGFEYEEGNEPLCGVFECKCVNGLCEKI